MFGVTEDGCGLDVAHIRAMSPAPSVMVEPSRYRSISIPVGHLFPLFIFLQIFQWKSQYSRNTTQTLQLLPALMRATQHSDLTALCLPDSIHKPHPPSSCRDVLRSEQTVADQQHTPASANCTLLHGLLDLAGAICRFAVIFVQQVHELFHQLGFSRIFGVLESGEYFGSL